MPQVSLNKFIKCELNATQQSYIEFKLILLQFIF